MASEGIVQGSPSMADVQLTVHPLEETDEASHDVEEDMVRPSLDNTTPWKLERLGGARPKSLPKTREEVKGRDAEGFWLA